MTGTPKRKSETSTTVKDTHKIWVTLTTKYADILDILADDTPDKTRSNRKSVLIEKMVDEFLEKHEKELTDDGKWDKIISVRKRAAGKLEKSIQEKITIIDNYLPVYVKLNKLSSIWETAKKTEEIEVIDKIYAKVQEIRKETTQDLDNLLASI
ncbi:MAG: hypothetical protein ACTSYU_07915 [Promethearchaeota archaeon]